MSAGPKGWILDATAAAAFLYVCRHEARLTVRRPQYDSTSLSLTCHPSALSLESMANRAFNDSFSTGSYG
jgi:hypothetical protein